MPKQIRANLAPTHAFRQTLEIGSFKITFKLDPANHAFAPGKPTYQDSMERWQEYLGLAASAGHIGAPISTTAITDNTLEITLPHSALFRASLSQQKYLAKVESMGAQVAAQDNSSLTPSVNPT